MSETAYIETGKEEKTTEERAAQVARIASGLNGRALKLLESGNTNNGTTINAGFFDTGAGVSMRDPETGQPTKSVSVEQFGDNIAVTRTVQGEVDGRVSVDEVSVALDASTGEQSAQHKTTESFKQGSLNSIGINKSEADAAVVQSLSEIRGAIAEQELANKKSA